MGVMTVLLSEKSRRTSFSFIGLYIQFPSKLVFVHSFPFCPFACHLVAVIMFGVTLLFDAWQLPKCFQCKAGAASGCKSCEMSVSEG